MRNVKHYAVIAVTLGLVGSGIWTSGAEAAETGGQAPPTVIVSDSSSPQGVAIAHSTDSGKMPGSVSAATSVVSPAGCTGYTDYPHKSGTDASVHGRMECKYAVPYVSTATAIVRVHWYGLETLNTGTAEKYNFWTSYDATPHASCLNSGSFDYKGFSAHRSVEGGVSYTSQTSNWRYPSPSHFTC